MGNTDDGTNWSGNLSSTPKPSVRPESESELQGLGEECREQGSNYRPWTATKRGGASHE